MLSYSLWESNRNGVSALGFALCLLSGAATLTLTQASPSLIMRSFRLHGRLPAEPSARSAPLRVLWEIHVRAPNALPALPRRHPQGSIGFAPAHRRPLGNPSRP